MFDWQTIIVALVILAALAYVSRRALNRLRSLRVSKHLAKSSCATGCGNCGDDGQIKTTLKSRDEGGGMRDEIGIDRLAH